MLRDDVRPHLCEELDTGLAVHVQVPSKGASPSCEGEEGQRHWYGHVDAHLNSSRRLSA